MEQSCLEIITVSAGLDRSDEHAINELIHKDFSCVFPELDTANLRRRGPEFGNLVSSSLGLVTIVENVVRGRCSGNTYGVDNAFMADAGLIDAIVVDVYAAPELFNGVVLSAGGNDFDDVTNFFHDEPPVW